MKSHARVLSLLISMATFTFISADNDNITFLTSANNQFSRQLFAQLAPSYENVVISPYSLHSALSMLSVGAEGDTLQEITDVLQTSNFAEGNQHKAYQELIQSFDNTGLVDVLTANGIFQNPKFTITESFQNNALSWYFAKAQEIDFQSPEGPESEINNWVDANTKGMIKNLLPPNTIDEEYTKTILVNTIFFKGNWSIPFDPTSNSRKFFNVNGSHAVQVEMMTTQGHFKMKKENEYTVLQLPFRDELSNEERFALYLVIPNNASELDSVNDCLPFTYPDYMYNISGLSTESIKLSMPKFEINFRHSMVDSLRSMGMNLAFAPEADFDGMSKGSQISEIVQQAVFKVTETGTTAAAATFISMNRMMVEYMDVTVDKPFWFFLRDDMYGEILFQGKFTRPQDNPSEFAEMITPNIPVCSLGASTSNDTDGAACPNITLFGCFLCVLFAVFPLF